MHNELEQVSVLTRGKEEPSVVVPGGPVLSRRKVLAVDDEPMLLRLLRAFFEDCEVTTAASVEEAIARLEESSQVDAILCDLMMPHCSGMDLYEQIRKRWAGTEKKMVFMTGGVFTEQASQFVHSVPNLFLEKPFDLLAARRAVEHAATQNVGERQTSVRGKFE